MNMYVVLTFRVSLAAEDIGNKLAQLSPTLKSTSGMADPLTQYSVGD